MPEAAYFTFIHTPYYQARAKGLLRDEDQIEVERLICENPEAGDQQAGVRKLRVRLKEKGKSGGVRVIYFCIEKKGHVYLLDVFPKSEKAALTKAEQNQMRKLAKLLENKP